MSGAEIFNYKLKIREQHIDTMGHMNNAAYLALFEEARWELITSKGFGIPEIRASRTGPVILEVALKFKSEITLRETITITTQLADYTGKICHIEQKMLKEDSTVAAQAIFTAALMDLKARKLIEPTDAWKKALGML